MSTPAPEQQPPADAPPADAPPADAPPAETPAPQDPPAEDDGAYFVIQDAGDTKPWALVRVRPRGLYERWCGPEEEWVDMPFFAAYFVGGEIGARQIDAAQAEQFKPVIPVPAPGVIAMMRGDDKRVGSAETPAPDDETPPEDETPAEDAADTAPEGSAADATDDEKPEE